MDRPRAPPNGLSIVKGEMGLVVAAIRATSRWAAHTYHEECQDVLLKSFHDLKEHLATIKYLEEVDSVTYLAPFLEVIRSENTTGPITGIALSSVNKMMSYNLLDISHPNCVTGVEAIADSVTHARFVGTDPANDEVVLMKILQVLRTLMLTPVGSLLNNETVCEVMQSCFRICFEMRLSELLRRTAEQTLMDMVQLLFVRLPDLVDDATLLSGNSSIRKALKRGLHVPDSRRGRRRRGGKRTRPKTEKVTSTECKEGTDQPKPENIRESVDTPAPDCPPPDTTNPPPPTDSLTAQESAVDPSTAPDTTTESVVDDSVSIIDDGTSQVDSLAENDTIGNVLVDAKSNKGEEQFQGDNFTNSRGVKFTQSDEDDGDTSPPYGLACIRELFSFLACIINPADTHNNKDMISIGLSLLTVAVETGGANLAKYQSLLKLCQNEVSRSLFRLIQGDSLNKMVVALRISNFMVESLRKFMKLQVEKYFIILMEIVVADPSKGSYERRELALDALVHLCRLPGLIPELYLNYDCHNYCANLYEDLTKALSKNAFPVSGLHITHLLSLDALLAVVNVIALQCQEDELCGDQTSEERLLPAFGELVERKEFKNKLIAGSNKFNENPSDGLKYLVSEGILNTCEPEELAHFLFTNNHLNKSQIGEFLGKKKNEHYLQQFIKNFDFVNLRIHEALRIFLESFRLPGEAQIIERIMTYFAEHWIQTAGTATNGIANTDSAFILSYAIIILNVDQHNKNTTIRKMDTAAFKHNQRGLNNGMDYPAEMLEDIFKSISENEIKMPDEHEGELRESYRWKVMLRRDEDAIYHPCGQVSLYNKTLFTLIWGPTVAALSFVFDTALDDDVTEKAISGFHKCASVSAHYRLSDVFDNLIISLCKFTGLLATGESPEEKTVQFGSNTKSRLTARTMFTLAHTHGDILREGWKNILECILQLYKANLMPNSLYQAFDFVHGHVQIQVEERAPAKQDQMGLFSSIFSLLNADTSGRGPTTQELEAQKQAKACVQECHPHKLFTDSKYLQEDSITELVQWLILLSSGPHTHAKNKTEYSEYTSAVFIELLATVILENRDRLGRLWGPVHNHINTIISPATAPSFLVERAVVTLLRLAVRMVGREKHSSEVIHSTIMLLLLKPNIAHNNSNTICYGLFELVRASIGSEVSYENWRIIFALLEMGGAGAKPPTVVVREREISDVTITDSEAPETSGVTTSGGTADTTLTDETANVGSAYSDSVLVNPVLENRDPDDDSGIEDNDLIRLPKTAHSQPPPADISQWTIEYLTNDKSTHQLELGTPNSYFQHVPNALGKACEALSLITRDSSIVRSDNFSLCVHAVRVFAEAYSTSCKDEGDKDHVAVDRETSEVGKDTSVRENKNKPRNSEQYSTAKPGLIQLLDLMHTLHTRALSIFKPPSIEGQRVPINDTSMQPIVGEVWVLCWCPLLQGIARVCCDPRKDVRQAGLTYLQRALLAHDLRALAAVEWEACFRQVMFPLLARLLEPITTDISALEETRMRAATLLCKAFLQHLSPLLALPGFTDLWLDILDFMDKYINSGSSDLLGEAIPENLKNMLLVMSNAGVFEEDNNYLVERNRVNEQHPLPTQEVTSSLWLTTWERIDKFRPTLKQELFPCQPRIEETQSEPALLSPDLQNQEIANTLKKTVSESTVTTVHETDNSRPVAESGEVHPAENAPAQPPMPPTLKESANAPPATVKESANAPPPIFKEVMNAAPPHLKETTIAPPPLPTDLQTLMSSTPQLVAPKPGTPVMYRRAPAPSPASKSEDQVTGPVTVEPLSSYLTH